MAAGRAAFATGAVMYHTHTHIIGGVSKSLLPGSVKTTEQAFKLTEEFSSVRFTKMFFGHLFSFIDDLKIYTI